ncbi:hypothetical protein [Desulfobaculum bizertense]|uniref:MetA-pathway of phenol degradation n=1 Tax=Desulfobaculum bizertense DSM 18034 TaxID=1121442 RepID=A0A1T4W443_9BACT|nr:hypothetical protein [Desulfobaculum bizertense]SKA71993.1 hypothetical protein SAMN02745702_01593 [Desulfobaculum bizertense DSM 18034]
MICIEERVRCLRSVLIALSVVVFFCQHVYAESQGDVAAAENSTSENSAAQANNPLANMTALNIQNYFIGDISDSDEQGNQAWLRYAKPFSVADTKWILRASLPFNTYPVGNDGTVKSGLGDVNVFASYLIDTGNPAVSFGFGPQVTLPTATESKLGSEKWSAGLVNVLFNADSPKFQYGYLLTWQHSFAGEDDRSDVNIGALQPFAFYQLGGGTYLRAAPIWSYNIENDNYNVPLGVGIGQVIKRGKTVFNFFIEPQFSAIHHGELQPQWQLYFGLNMQFLD